MQKRAALTPSTSSVISSSAHTHRALRVIAYDNVAERSRIGLTFPDPPTLRLRPARQRDNATAGFSPDTALQFLAPSGHDDRLLSFGLSVEIALSS